LTDLRNNYTTLLVPPKCDFIQKAVLLLVITW